MALTVPAAAQYSVVPDTPQYVRNTFGEVGMLDMPSAHMAPDGDFGFTMGDVGNYQRYSAHFQALPWLEASFRYSRVKWWLGNSLFWDRSFGAKIRLLNEDDNFADVSVGVRDLLGTGVYGSEYVVASRHIGALDFTGGFGWGRMADNQTLPNPFGVVFKSFKTRTPPDITGTLNFGQFFHGPKTGVFGGVIWDTPIEGLSLIAEYSSDEYSKEARYAHGLKPRSPVNLGLSYEPLKNVRVSGGWFYGTTYGFTVSLDADPRTEFPSGLRMGPELPPPTLRTDDQQQAALRAMHVRNGELTTVRTGGPWVELPTPEQHKKQEILQALYSTGRGVRDIELDGKSLVIDATYSTDPSTQCAGYAQIAASTNPGIKTVALADLANPQGRVTFCNAPAPHGLQIADSAEVPREFDPAQIQKKIRADLTAQSLGTLALWVGTSEAWVYYENGRYNDESEAAGRIARILMADAPPSVEIFHIVPTESGVPMQEITVPRSSLERAIQTRTGVTALGPAISVTAPPMENPPLQKAMWDNYPRYYWGLAPHITEHVFDPNKPLQFLLYASADGSVQLAPGLLLGATVTGTLWTDYNFARDPGSALPHVRTDVLRYLEKGKYGISGLQLSYETRLSPEVLFQTRAGYLEDMFAGAGAQVLWRPEGSRLTFGADVYEVWKRDYNRLFGLQNYKVATGHVSVYYESPWYGLNYAVHVGRYLAGDYGGTFQVTRRFDSGVEIGAWATFTNVPFSKFGEGSFDKGLIIRIPFEWGLPIYSQASYSLHLASLTRDGGQRLAGDDSLYDATRSMSYGDITEHLDELVDP